MSARRRRLAAAAGVSRASAARDFRLAEQEEVLVVRRQRVVGRRPDHVARPRRTHQMRRHDDDEIGLVLLIGLRREQRAQHRHAAEPGQLLDLVLGVGLQQTADREALAVAQFDRGRGAAHDQRRHRDRARHRHGMGGVDRAHFRLDLHVDQATAKHGRRESQADAIFFVIDGDLALVAGHRDRIFAAGQEAGGVAGERDQIGLGQTAGDALLLKRVDQHVGRHAVCHHAGDHEAEGRTAGNHAGRHFAGRRNVACPSTPRSAGSTGRLSASRYW